MALGVHPTLDDLLCDLFSRAVGSKAGLDVREVLADSTTLTRVAIPETVGGRLTLRVGVAEVIPFVHVLTMRPRNSGDIVAVFKLVQSVFDADLVHLIVDLGFDLVGTHISLGCRPRIIFWWRGVRFYLWRLTALILCRDFPNKGRVDEPLWRFDDILHHGLIDLTGVDHPHQRGRPDETKQQGNEQQEAQ